MEVERSLIDYVDADEEDLSFGKNQRKPPKYTPEQLAKIYKNMSSYFGNLSSSAAAKVPALLQLEQYEDREVQQDILWQGFEGENVFIQTFISKDFKNIKYRDFLLREFNIYEFDEMLRKNPSMYVYDKMVRWTSYASPEILPDATAEGTPGQYFSSIEQKEEKYMAECTMVGFRMGQDWLNSARQRKFFWMNVMTLNKALNAFLACNFYDSIIDGGLLEYQELSPFSKALPPAEFHRQLTLRCDRFAACNKGGLSFKGLETWMFEKISDLGGDMNFFLADQQALRTLSLEGAPAQVHALGGPEAKQIDKDMFYQRPEQSDGKLFPISPAHKIQIYTCRQFIKKNRKIYNPLAFDTTAGQMFPALGNQYVSRLKDYESCMRNLDIVNGNTHSWDRKTQMDFVDASGLFRDDNNTKRKLLTVLGIDILSVALGGTTTNADPYKEKKEFAKDVSHTGGGNVQEAHKDWLNALQIFRAANLTNKIVPTIQRALKTNSAARSEWNKLPRYAGKKASYPLSSHYTTVPFGSSPVEKLIEKTAFDAYNLLQSQQADRIVSHTVIGGSKIKERLELDAIVNVLNSPDANGAASGERLSFLRKLVALYAITTTMDATITSILTPLTNINQSADPIDDKLNLIEATFLDKSSSWSEPEIIAEMRQIFGQNKPQYGASVAAKLKRKAYESVMGDDDYEYSATEGFGYSKDVVESSLKDIMISYEMFQFFDTYNILIPINWVLLRPYVQVQMSMLVGGMKGDETAIMIYKNATTAIVRERDIQQVKYNVKMTAGTVCTNRKRLITEPYALCTGVKSGVGTRFFDWHEKDLKLNLKNNDFKDRDMFCILAPWNTKVSDGIAVDLLGRFHQESCASPVGAKPHIETQDVYKGILGLHHTPDSNQFGLNYVMNHRPVNSTVCVRGTYRSVNDKGDMELKVGVDWFSPGDAEYAFAILGGAGAYSGRGIERFVPAKGR